MQEKERDGMYESVGKTLLVGREGEACEIARAYLFLMHEGYSTGQVVVIDGGGVLV
jgi:NAD(P)-dependent dehydrogenase (short-subunit alcohol dehydrogenase family)